ncbi:MAG: chromosomal replication initiator DnaA [Deltaproteobacteria bacterium]|nr:chromosomal replication initiator DnaA [Deltaproteobacteria bacterium]
MTTQTPVKDALRVHLARLCAEDDLRSWYDPLQIEMNQDENRLTVTFPHHLFGPWFAGAGRASLESCLAPCLGKDITVSYLARRRHARPSTPMLPSTRPRVQTEQSFGEHFTLECFLINKKNFFPLAVAREVAKGHKEPNYNPLIYYGKSGCGKTHLLRAIANELGKIYNDDNIFYGDLSKFIQEHESGADFSLYQAYCIDDVHLFANNFPAQEKLLQVLNVCLHGKKQFVCACSGSLASHRGFAESLRSRLEQGIIVELKNPDIDVRMRFAQAQCATHGIHPTQEHLLMLAQRCEHLRYLSGVLLKLAAYKKLTQQELTELEIKKILKNSGEHSPITPQDVIRRVAEHFSLSPEDITGNKRTSGLVHARQTAIYLCRQILGVSYPALGKLFGGKDHSTIIYSIKKVEKNLVAHKDAHIKLSELQNLCVQKKT